MPEKNKKHQDTQDQSIKKIRNEVKKQQKRYKKKYNHTPNNAQKFL